jgi:LysR family transcriptional regulator of beta-lactamase
MHLPLNALRAFEVSARHLSFTRAADELNVTQTAVSQQVRNLEQRLNVQLFRRLPRGLALTDEGLALLPALTEAFERMAQLLDRFDGERPREVLAVGVVATFAVGWLLSRLREFQQAQPFVDLRLFTHNNRVDLAAEGLDMAIRFGDGAWHGVQADVLLHAPLAPLCAPALAARLRQPVDLAAQPLLRSYRANEWAQWFEAAGVACPTVRGPVFDSSVALAQVAAQGTGVALLPPAMFARELRQGSLVRPFALAVDAGSYWLTKLKSRPETPAMQAFRAWLRQACQTPG